MRRLNLLALVFGPQKEDSLILRKVSDIWFRTAVKFLTVVFFIFGALQSRPAGTKRLLKKRKKLREQISFFYYRAVFNCNRRETRKDFYNTFKKVNDVSALRYAIIKLKSEKV